MSGKVGWLFADTVSPLNVGRGILLSRAESLWRQVDPGTENSGNDANRSNGSNVIGYTMSERTLSANNRPGR